jgi:hypothetical protein
MVFFYTGGEEGEGGHKKWSPSKHAIYFTMNAPLKFAGITSLKIDLTPSAPQASSKKKQTPW